tara:strand:- start:27 stop:545 length:519 start_codon:yes stop_codon:yes gene_type:complete
MAIKKKLSKELSDLISEYLSKGGKIKKLPAGRAKGADEKANVKPKNLPRDKQGKTLKFDADNEVRFKDGGMPKPKPKPKRTITKEQFDSIPRDMIGVLKMLAKKQLTQDEERKLKDSAKTDSRIVKEAIPPKPKSKPKGPSPRRGKGLKGGGTLRVTKRGPLYKGNKSGSYS